MHKNMKHILESRQFDRAFLNMLFASARELENVRNDDLKGKIGEYANEKPERDKPVHL